MKLHPSDHNYHVERPKDKDPTDNHCNHVYQVKAGRWREQWTYCDNRPGEKTKHPGYGRCWIHGGDTGVGVTKRYRLRTRAELRERVDAHFGAEQPLDLYEELALNRALYETAIEEHDEFRTAITMWYRSFEKENRGLHDAPLYHAATVSRMMEEATQRGDDPTKMTMRDLNHYLDRAARDLQQEWMERKRGRDGEDKPHFKVTKPESDNSITELTKLAKMTQELVTTISKREAEAYLKKSEFEGLVLDLIRIFRSEQNKLLRLLAEELKLRLKDNGVTDPITVATLMSWSKDGTGIERATQKLKESVNERIEPILKRSLGE